MTCVIAWFELQRLLLNIKCSLFSLVTDLMLCFNILVLWFACCFAALLNVLVILLMGFVFSELN